MGARVIVDGNVAKQLAVAWCTGPLVEQTSKDASHTARAQQTLVVAVSLSLFSPDTVSSWRAAQHYVVWAAL
eukprot:1494564-Amphidinium_carterae.1